MNTVRNRTRSEALRMRGGPSYRIVDRRSSVEGIRSTLLMKLVLFDIDGTLITDGGASRSAFAAALRDVYGYDGDLARYDFSGRTDPQITHMVLSDAGLSRD